MASTSFHFTANTFINHSSTLPKHNVPHHFICKASSSPSPSSSSFEQLKVSKRSLAMSLSSVIMLGLAGQAKATPLEAEDDLELLEKVKEDRKKRLERQKIINSSTKEKGYLQEVLYKLSEVGQAIENNDLNAASSVLPLNSNSNSEWINKANSAFGKLTETDEEKAEVDAFNTSVSQLISSVGDKDMESTKLAFVSSAIAFEKWITLTGLEGQLKGL